MIKKKRLALSAFIAAMAISSPFVIPAHAAPEPPQTHPVARSSVIKPYKPSFLDLQATHSLPEIPYSEALKLASDHKLSLALFSFSFRSIPNISIATLDGHVYRAATPGYNLAPEFLSSGAQVKVTDGEENTQASSLTGTIAAFFTNFVTPVVMPTLSIVMLVLLILYLSKHTRTPARRFKRRSKEKAVTFADIAGHEEIKGELMEFVDYLKNPKEFSDLGVAPPKGALLHGEPGNGKTMLARAIAGEAKVPFFSLNGSDIVGIYAGTGAAKVRKAFAQARKASPCILFVDEIDAVGETRGTTGGDVGKDYDNILNQFLVEMDGVDKTGHVVVIGATNRPTRLDPALTRAGRMDRELMVSAPDVAAREQLFRIQSRTIPFAKDVDYGLLAKLTPGFSGADLKNLVNEAGYIARRNKSKVIDMDCLDGARDRVIMGLAKKGIRVSDEDRRLVAYHEAGHAVVGMAEGLLDPIYKATIIPRGSALGLVARIPDSDRHLRNTAHLQALIRMMMGGRAAEQVIFGGQKVTNGASSDISQATTIARNMIGRWGMDEAIGPVNILDPLAGVEASPEMRATFDAKVGFMLQAELSRATDELRASKDALEAVAEALLERETLSGAEITEIVRRLPKTIPSQAA